jgi:hypothetical protein
LKYRILNNGPKDVSSAYVVARLSTDDTSCETTDTYLAAFYANVKGNSSNAAAIACTAANSATQCGAAGLCSTIGKTSGTCSYLIRNVTIPSTVVTKSSNSARICLWVDPTSGTKPNGNIIEYNESNNLSYRSISTIGKTNLYPYTSSSNFKTDKSTYGNSEPMKIDYKIYNSGGINFSYTVYTAFYLSLDTQLCTKTTDAGCFKKTVDVYLGQHSNSADIGPQKSVGSSYQLTVGSSIPAGTYYLFAKTDHKSTNANGYITELSETDNAKAKSGKVTIKAKSLSLSYKSYSTCKGYSCSSSQWKRYCASGSVAVMMLGYVNGSNINKMTFYCKKLNTNGSFGSGAYVGGSESSATSTSASNSKTGYIGSTSGGSYLVPDSFYYCKDGYGLVGVTVKGYSSGLRAVFGHCKSLTSISALNPNSAAYSYSNYAQDHNTKTCNSSNSAYSSYCGTGMSSSSNILNDCNIYGSGYKCTKQILVGTTNAANHGSNYGSTFCPAGTVVTGLAGRVSGGKPTNLSLRCSTLNWTSSSKSAAIDIKIPTDTELPK